MLTGAFIQARMSSSRFPGKVLAPLHGKPILRHVIDRVALCIRPSLITVLTSREESDDPIAAFCQWLNIPVFRGSLDNVFLRFRQALEIYPCDYFFRITADSPQLRPDILQRMLLVAMQNGGECDLVTNALVRSYPVGQSVELIKTSTFLTIDPETLDSQEEEHVTPYFYRNHKQFYIINLENPQGDQSEVHLAVDTLEDIQRLERDWEPHPASK